MSWLIQVFGEGRDINTLQMSCRGIAVFLIALVLIRISGRRSFGIRTPLDNIILILLGATLSRTIVGASPFLPTIVTCVVLVALHRFLAWLMVHNLLPDVWVEGKRFLLFKNGQFIKKNMQKALVCEDDVMQGVRKSALTESLDKIDAIYMERNGEISAIKKET